MIVQQTFDWFVGDLADLYAQIGAVLAKHLLEIESYRPYEVGRDRFVIFETANVRIEKVVHTLIYHILYILLLAMLGAETHE